MLASVVALVNMAGLITPPFGKGGADGEALHASMQLFCVAEDEPLSFT
jgi:hypothetical protein